MNRNHLVDVKAILKLAEHVDYLRSALEVIAAIPGPQGEVARSAIREADAEEMPKFPFLER